MKQRWKEEREPTHTSRVSLCTLYKHQSELDRYCWDRSKDLEYLKQSVKEQVKERARAKWTKVKEVWIDARRDRKEERGEELTCLIVMAGFQLFSSFKIDRQTVPEGKMLGWKIGGLNLPVDKILTFIDRYGDWWQEDLMIRWASLTLGWLRRII